MTQYTTLQVEQQEGVVTITLNRPEKYNALNQSVAEELMAVFQQAQEDATQRCLVLTGAGRGFCSGQDLSDVAGRDLRDFSFRHHLEEGYNKMVLAMRNLPKPILVAVNGPCVGAGLGLALAGDIRYASDKAKFLTAFIGIGLGPDTGVSYWLPRLVGPARAAELLFTNDPVDAATAAQIGLVNKVVAAEQLMTETMQLAKRLAQAPTVGIGITKQALNRSLGVDFATLLSVEAELQEVAGHSADYIEGTTAFREKRAPKFVGR